MDKIESLFVCIVIASFLWIGCYIAYIVDMYQVNGAYPQEIMKCYENGRLTGITEVPKALLQDSVWYANGCLLSFVLPVLVFVYVWMAKRLGRISDLSLGVAFTIGNWFVLPVIGCVLLIIISIAGSILLIVKLDEVYLFAVEIKHKDWDSEVYGCRWNATLDELQEESDDLYWTVEDVYRRKIGFYVINGLVAMFFMWILCCGPCVEKSCEWINKCYNNCRRKRKLKRYMKMKKKFFKERNKILNKYLYGQKDCIVIIDRYLQDLECIQHLQDETTLRKCYMHNIDYEMANASLLGPKTSSKKMYIL